jgi:hypothetical protein
MRFQLTSAWPASAAMIEPGTIIDGNSPQYRGVVMPLTVLCLDQDAANAMASWYPYLADILHLHVRYAAGVNPKKEN